MGLYGEFDIHYLDWNIFSDISFNTQESKYFFTIKDNQIGRNGSSALYEIILGSNNQIAVEYLECQLYIFRMDPRPRGPLCISLPDLSNDPEDDPLGCLQRNKFKKWDILVVWRDQQ